MQQNSSKTFNKTNVMIAAAVVSSLMLTTGGIVSASNTSSVNSKSPTASAEDNHESQAAIDLRVGLNTLLRDHVTTNLTVNRLIASGASEADIQAAISGQEANANSLAAAVGSIYGSEAEAQFLEMFLEHIEESNNFARAVAAGDESAKLEANEELQEYLEEIATFFSTAIPVLPYEAVYSLLLEHETLINQSTEALDKNFGQSKKFEQQALRQVSVIADALASGIIETQPDIF